MKIKLGIICTICIIVCMLFCNIPQKPKLISSITTMDTAYLTILIDKRDVRSTENLKEKIIQMCMADSFENMKLQTKDKPLAEKLNISVYTSKWELQNGTPYMIIKNDAGE